MIGKKICFWAMAAIVFICSASDSLWAMTNEEFLNFCAGKASPETYESYSDLGNPSISEALKANPNLDVNFQGSGGETPLMLVAANPWLIVLRPVGRWAERGQDRKR